MNDMLLGIRYQVSVLYLYTYLYTCIRSLMLMLTFNPHVLRNLGILIISRLHTYLLSVKGSREQGEAENYSRGRELATTNLPTHLSIHSLISKSSRVELGFTVRST